MTRDTRNSLTLGQCLKLAMEREQTTLGKIKLGDLTKWQVQRFLTLKKLEKQLKIKNG